MNTNEIIELILSFSFNKTLAAIFFAYACAGLLASLFIFEEVKQQRSLKISSLFLIIGLTLLADRQFVFILTIFITATSITSLEFLKSFAAIIFKNKYYFRFETAKLSPSEAKEKKELEQKIILFDQQIDSQAPVASNNPENVPNDIESIAKDNASKARAWALQHFSETVSEALLYENKFFETISKPVSRNIKILGKNKIFECDGLEETETYFKIYEVKYLKVAPVFKTLQSMVLNFQNLINEITELRGKDVIGEIVFIGEFNSVTRALIQGMIHYSSLRKIAIKLIEKNEFEV